MKNVIPNAITALNLFLGMVAIVYVIKGAFIMGAIFIFFALIADAMDGRAARYFGVSSEFGKELDSLCDVVSFGVAPGILAYQFALQDNGLLGLLIAALFAVCGALRLARFNINTGTVKGYFMGLPIPAAGCVVASFTMLGIKPASWIYLLFVAICAYLMISTIRYPDFKGKEGEPIRLIPAVVSVLVGGYILYISPQGFLFVIFFTYVLFGILNTLFGMFSRPTAT